jgi:hypothetical protein
MTSQLPALMIATLLLYGCQDTTSSSEVWDQTGLPPDFQLEDVNSTSTAFGEEVSPRDRLESVSGWYFAHAT